MIRVPLRDNCRYDPVTALTKSHRLKAIQKFIEKNRGKTHTDVPDILARFDDLLLRYSDDCKTQALSDDLKKEALKELIPGAWSRPSRTS